MEAQQGSRKPGCRCSPAGHVPSLGHGSSGMQRQQGMRATRSSRHAASGGSGPAAARQAAGSPQDAPEPEGPSSAVMVPGSMHTSAPLTARNSPRRVLKCLTMPRTSTWAPCTASAGGGAAACACAAGGCAACCGAAAASAEASTGPACRRAGRGCGRARCCKSCCCCCRAGQGRAGGLGCHCRRRAAGGRRQPSACRRRP